MKFKLIILTVILSGIFYLDFWGNESYAKVINTVDISRFMPPPVPAPPSIPNPPTPPTKPEPPTPPVPPGVTPTPLPTHTPTPELTPTPTPVTPTGESNQGIGGAPFQFGGPPPPSQVTGQVLGASTLGGTGASENNLFSLIFILGCLSTSIGIRKIATTRV